MPTMSIASEGTDVITLETVAATTICNNCGNDDERGFLTDPRQGEVICTRCGAVALEHQMHDGDWTRAFEGEESTSQVGPPPDPLLSNRANLRTGMSIAPGVSKTRMRSLRLITEAVEMGTSGVMGVSDKRTRVSYMDRQKVKAGIAMEAVCDRLDIPRPVLQRAKGIFAAFRESRQHVTSLSESIASCLISAYEEAVFMRMRADRDKARENVEADAQDAADAAAEAEEAAARGDVVMTDGAAGSSSFGTAGTGERPAKRALTEEEAAAARRKRHEGELAAIEAEEKRARALGLLGPTLMITGDDEEEVAALGAGSASSAASAFAAGSGSSTTKGAGAGAGAGKGAKPAPSPSSAAASYSDAMGDDNDDDVDVDDDELLLRRLEAERKARGRAAKLDFLRKGKGAVNSAAEAAIAQLQSMASARP